MLFDKRRHKRAERNTLLLILFQAREAALVTDTSEAGDKVKLSELSDLLRGRGAVLPHHEQQRHDGDHTLKRSLPWHLWHK